MKTFIDLDLMFQGEILGLTDEKGITFLGYISRGEKRIIFEKDRKELVNLDISMIDFSDLPLFFFENGFNNIQIDRVEFDNIETHLVKEYFEKFSDIPLDDMNPDNFKEFIETLEWLINTDFNDLRSEIF